MPFITDRLRATHNLIKDVTVAQLCRTEAPNSKILYDEAHVRFKSFVSVHQSINLSINQPHNQLFNQPCRASSPDPVYSSDGGLKQCTRPHSHGDFRSIGQAYLNKRRLEHCICKVALFSPRITSSVFKLTFRASSTKMTASFPSPPPPPKLHEDLSWRTAIFFGLRTGLVFFLRLVYFGAAVENDMS